MPSQHRLILRVAALVAIAGCQEDVAPLPIAAPQPVRSPTVDVVEPVEAEAGPIVEEVYSPPYPDREDLFKPPQRTRATARRNDTATDETVELIGFVSVDVTRAVLSIDGVIASVEAGGQKYGIQVISITPPEVVLQRGRTRWTASLD